MTQHTDLPTTRVAARALGLKHYFTGKPCSRGHVAARHITGTCVECQQIANNAWAARNPGEGLRRSRKWQKAHPEQARANSLRSWRKTAGIPTAPYPMPEICEWPECTRKAEHLDHDHETGAFRGFLCRPHNMGLGLIGDTVVAIQHGIDYLTKTRGLP